MILSSEFSTERDEPFLSDDDEEYEHWNEKANNNNRRNSVNVKSILFMKAMQSSEMAFSIYVLLE
jgi:hypothetical protein